MINKLQLIGVSLLLVAILIGAGIVYKNMVLIPQWTHLIEASTAGSKH